MIYTADGSIATPRTIQTVPPEYLKMLAVLAETSGTINLGLHCSQCKQDVRGSNSERQGRWTMECACRTFIGANPLPRSH